MMDSGTPEKTYREEIEAALENDQTRIGDVFRSQQSDENKSAQSIADELGTTVGPVHSWRRSLETLFECKRIVGGTTEATQKASMLRAFANSKRHASILSEATRRALHDLAEEHDRFASDLDVITREGEVNEHALDSDDRLNVPGIYVYTYPHYNKSPVKPSQEDYTDDRTYLKIGVTEAAEGVSKRIKQQIGEVRTALPESPLILRIYNADGVDLKETEKKIQRHLDAADHSQINRQRGSGVGMEWYLTHLKFLDSVADLLGLEVKYEHRDGEEG